jgi:N-acylneuraminate cytidylyltransferase
MVHLDERQSAELVISPVNGIALRQDAPPVYDMTTVAYAARPQFILESERLFSGRVSAVIVPVERAADIDTELDFRMAEAMVTMSQE